MKLRQAMKVIARVRDGSDGYNARQVRRASRHCARVYRRAWCTLVRF